MNEFNRLQIALDNSGLTESCDTCNQLIRNWNSVGDMATLADDGVTIVCKKCLRERQPVVESPV